MSYMALARKWRPQQFADVVGQKHVLAALTNSLAQQTLHHAYLFSGTRGVGKTTLARLFAKSLNCEQGVSAHPCGHCSNCRAVEQGQFVDLIEIDAASRTKVEDTRDVLDNVQYRPTRGRYKIYLIDEVHMLSRHSFNALLKTLEEPPEHVKFLLATTDPQKLPVTVLSRCLQFQLTALTEPQIGSRLEQILGAEALPFEPNAVQLLANAAQGSMRDALSLTDQALAVGGGKLQYQSVLDMLGTIDPHHIRELLQFIFAGDSQSAFAKIDAIKLLAPDYEQLHQQLALWLHRIALEQLLHNDDDEYVRALASRCDSQFIQLLYQIAITGKRDLPYAPTPASGFDMTVLRMMAFRPAAEVAPTEINRPIQSSPEASSSSAVVSAVTEGKPAAELSAPTSPRLSDDDEVMVQQLNQEQDEIQGQAERLLEQNRPVAAETSAPQTSAPVSTEPLGTLGENELQQRRLNQEQGEIEAQAEQQSPQNQPVAADASSLSASRKASTEPSITADEAQAQQLNREVSQLQAQAEQLSPQNQPPQQASTDVAASDAEAVHVSTVEPEQTSTDYLSTAALLRTRSLLRSQVKRGETSGPLRTQRVQPSATVESVPTATVTTQSEEQPQRPSAESLPDAVPSQQVAPEPSVESDSTDNDIPPWASESIPYDDGMLGPDSDDLEGAAEQRLADAEDAYQQALTTASPAEYKRESVLAAEQARSRRTAAQTLSKAIQPADIKLPEHRWAALLDQLQIGPRARQVGLNAVYEQQPEQLLLTVKPQFKHLLQDAIMNELRQAFLACIDVPAVNFAVGERPELQTPLEHQHECNQIKYDAARGRLQQDPNVQFIINRFGASLDDDSIEF